MQIWMTWAQAADLLHTSVEELVRYARSKNWNYTRAGVEVWADRLALTRQAVKAREWPCPRKRAA